MIRPFDELFFLSYHLYDIVGHEAQLVCIVHGEANPEVNNWKLFSFVHIIIILCMYMLYAYLSFLCFFPLPFTFSIYCSFSFIFLFNSISSQPSYKRIKYFLPRIIYELNLNILQNFSWITFFVLTNSFIFIFHFLPLLLPTACCYIDEIFVLLFSAYFYINNKQVFYNPLLFSITVNVVSRLFPSRSDWQTNNGFSWRSSYSYNKKHSAVWFWKLQVTNIFFFNLTIDMVAT